MSGLSRCRPKDTTVSRVWAAEKLMSRYVTSTSHSMKRSWDLGQRGWFTTMLLRHGMSQYFPLFAFIGARWRWDPCSVRVSAEMRRVGSVENHNRPGLY